MDINSKSHFDDCVMISDHTKVCGYKPRETLLDFYTQIDFGFVEDYDFSRSEKLGPKQHKQVHAKLGH